MTAACPPHTDTREHILSTAEPLVLGKGFTALGLTELLSAAGVPKGSFYHYFRSKEQFGQALLERYFANYDARLASHFAAEPGRMRDRLLSYFAGWITQACQADSHGSCLAVKLAGEVCDLSEPMREALAVGMAQVCARLADAIARAAAEGSLATCADPAALADALYAMWLGAALRTKVMRDSSPLVRALADTEQRLAWPSR
ncbi:TetR/AcrR family transcriptional regulator [Rivihabitans pingtungensis]|uniref:TetR family transcriptional regulator n=1 Tax=Rivihabitans pingtungensis TaxID=1054498 RepID=A0A318KQ01_9NEIS|nr:TetR/AcrR family transcriptional regulator [Rivihabitans pingtungensis]PXX78858.1 TetR family transcriptional regulator [Rivihabitans pingtungensis]